MGLIAVRQCRAGCGAVYGSEWRWVGVGRAVCGWSRSACAVGWRGRLCVLCRAMVCCRLKGKAVVGHDYVVGSGLLDRIKQHTPAAQQQQQQQRLQQKQQQECQAGHEEEEGGGGGGQCGADGGGAAAAATKAGSSSSRRKQGSMKATWDAQHAEHVFRWTSTEEEAGVGDSSGSGNGKQQNGGKGKAAGAAGERVRHRLFYPTPLALARRVQVRGWKGGG